MIDKLIAKLVEKKGLTAYEAKKAFEEIMSGKASEVEISSFLVALKEKGETVEEITAAARVMRSKMISQKIPGIVVDTCGTGGSGKNKFNISTVSAFVVAGCGLKVAKHGNRAASGRVGSADLLEALGINLNTAASVSFDALKRVGISFFFAPTFHRAMKYAAPVRKKLKIRTIFNILGPLCNPAGANIQVIGVFDKSLILPVAEVLKKLGSRACFVVHSDDGLDEVSIAAKATVAELKHGRIRQYKISPLDFGIKKQPLEGIRGGDAHENARILLEILKGKTGPKRDIVLMNASLALVAAGKAKNFKEGFKLAAESIDSQNALNKLEELREFYYI
jgi:anthranilate phosphoribosyltransferase